MSSRRADFLVGGIAFVVLAAWICAYPATGEGDAVLHYLDARNGVYVSPARLLTSWSRPLFKLLIVGPSLLGMIPARLAVAGAAAVMAWQTTRLARDVGLPRPWLAGALVLLQPFAFSMAIDVMTEVPAALAFLIAMRLWIHRRRGWSSLVVGFTPLIRPEGFFLILAWGVMILITAAREREAFRKWFTHGLLLGVGLLAWCLAGLVVTGDALYVLHSWSWPAGGWKSTVPGTIYHHFQYWPWYAGSALFPLFLIGVPFSIRRGMGLVWMVWWLVIGVHTILYWRGFFGAMGVLRILVVSAPSTALICLIGFNQVAAWLRAPAILRWAVGVAYFIFAGWVVHHRYWGEPQHWSYLAVHPAAQYIRSHNLLSPGTKFFTAENFVLVPLGHPRGGFDYVANDWDPAKHCELLRSLPSGSIGVWDNGQSNGWYQLTIDDLPALGYEILTEFSVTGHLESPRYMYRRVAPWPVPMRYAVVRKR